MQNRLMTKRGEWDTFSSFKGTLYFENEHYLCNSAKNIFFRKYLSMKTEEYEKLPYCSTILISMRLMPKHLQIPTIVKCYYNHQWFLTPPPIHTIHSKELADDTPHKEFLKTNKLFFNNLYYILMTTTCSNTMSY